MAVDTAEIRFEKARDVFEALKWVIAHAPEDGTPLNGHAIFARTIEGARSIGLPTVTAIYVVEEHEIIIKSVKFDEASSRPRTH